MCKKLIEAIDLFCGAGGLTCGLNKLDEIKVLCGIDNDPFCQYPYAQNNKSHFLLKNIEDVKSNELLPFFSGKSVKLLAGCAPCQTFSRYNPKANSNDSRWRLLLEFGRLVREIQPEYVTIENVPGLIKQKVFESFVRLLKRQSYKLWYDIVNCSEYGLPQHRHRLVLLASRLGSITLLSPKETNSKLVTVRKAIGKLQKIEAGSVCPNDPLHRSPNLTEQNLKRIQYSVAGQSWRIWPKHLILNCHKKTKGKTYVSVYGRMSWTTPSPTITTQFFGFGNGRFGHPEQDRAISLREGAILQGFSNDYVFEPPNTPLPFACIGRLIGNAVPIRLGEVIGMSFVRHLQSYQQSRKNYANQR
jgi:DNA (cytosine-5)-methyltransferase 1